MEKTKFTDSPKVSVLVPCYNHEEFIEECVLSIINQTYPNIDLIVIDDGSTDNSFKKLQNLREKFEFRLYSHENVGISKTLNFGLELAKGKYICILASDDYWAPEKLAEQVHVMEKEPEVKLCFTDIIHVDSKSRKIKMGLPYVERVELTQDFEYVLMHATLPPASIMVRAEEIKRKGGFDPDFQVEDLDLWLKVLVDGGQAKIINKHLSYYRFHDNNTHSTKKEMLFEEQYKTVQKFLIFTKNKKKIKTEWELRSANKLANVNKKKSLNHLVKGIHKFWDIRIYKSLVKWIIN